MVNQIPFEKILRGNPHRSFVINFRCKPFWYLSDVEPITLSTFGTFITNPGSVASEPVITVYDSGEITLMVGMTITVLEITDKITLDTPLMEAYVGATSMNSFMSGDFPVAEEVQDQTSYIGSHYEQVYGIELDNEVNAKAYRKDSEFITDDFQKLKDYFHYLYPDYDEIFAKRIQ